MILPTIDQPIYEVNLLTSDKPVRFRPFLVKEQKIMLMAVEAKDIDTTIKSIKQIIKNCVIDHINVDELPLADLETLFLHLRARSMGEVLNLYFKCTNKIGAVGLETPCNMVLEVPVNLLTDVKQINTHTPKKIMFNDTVGVIMKYPSIEIVDELVKAEDAKVQLTVVSQCIDKIFDKDNVYKASDASPEELLSFVENLPTAEYGKMEKFIGELPKSQFKTHKKCTKCGFEHEFVLEGLNDFFL